jgi:hypothetical protein
MTKISRAAAALVVVALAAPCWAGQVKLEIRGGLVTLSAKDASVREILAEWSRVGQTRIVNAERVAGGLVNLELTGVPEARALDIVLRAVAGYVAAPRVVTTSAGSRFDRIMIMALPRPAAGGAAPVAMSPAPQPFDRARIGSYQPQPSLMVDDQDEPVASPQPQPATTPGGAAGASQPGMPTAIPPGIVIQAPYGQPGVPPPTATPNPAAARPGVITTPTKPPGSPGGGPTGL